MKTTGDIQLLKRINRSVLLRLMLNSPGLSRARLAVYSGLTKSTVSGLVRELIDEQWLKEADSTVAAVGMGRPSTPLYVDSATRVFIGIEIAVECLRLVCVGVTGTILFELEAPLKNSQPDRVCTQVARLVKQMCDEIQSRGQLLSGVGLCLPGAINDESGIVRLAPNLKWRNVAFLPVVAHAFGVAGVPSTQIHLQNDADAAAIGEYEFGASNGDDPLIFVNCDVGVGAGIVLNDRLFTGSVGTAGEIGHTILQVNGPLCSCGRRGCAETFIGSRSLRKSADLDAAGEYLGVLIQNLDAMFNPRVLVLGGRSCINNPGLVETARKTLLTYALGAGLPAPEVRAARYGLQAAAVGAAALVLHRFLRPMLVGAFLDTAVNPGPAFTASNLITLIQERYLGDTFHVLRH
jgi:predicted NBD/HSP70 family sugar kinase